MEMVFKYTGAPKDAYNVHLSVYPPDYSIVRVVQSRLHSDSFNVIGYEYNSLGGTQHFHKRHFRPLSDVLAEISIAELVEEVVEC